MGFLLAEWRELTQSVGEESERGTATHRRDIQFTNPRVQIYRSSSLARIQLDATSRGARREGAAGRSRIGTACGTADSSRPAEVRTKKRVNSKKFWLLFQKVLAFGFLAVVVVAICHDVQEMCDWSRN